MSTSWKSADVGCPFYKSDDGKQKIICEGLIPNSSVVISYRRKVDWQAQLNTACCRDYNKCRVYKMLMHKYEEKQ